MNTEQMNTLLDSVLSLLNNSGCDYFLTVVNSGDEATIGSASINMNDIDAGADFIVQSIRQGGAHGQRMSALLSQVFELLSSEQDEAQELEASETVRRHREEREQEEKLSYHR